jgi:hypothetical protein
MLRNPTFCEPFGGTVYSQLKGILSFQFTSKTFADDTRLTNIKSVIVNTFTSPILVN